MRHNHRYHHRSRCCISAVWTVGAAGARLEAYRRTDGGFSKVGWAAEVEQHEMLLTNLGRGKEVLNGVDLLPGSPNRLQDSRPVRAT